MPPIPVGGQAIIEGVMIRAGKSLAMAARRADGSIRLETRAVNSLADRWPCLKWPLLRGALMLFESLLLGFQALEWSGEQALEEGPEDPARRARGAWRKQAVLGLTLLFGLGLGVLLFVVAPYYAAQATARWLPGGSGSLAFNLQNGTYKIAVFLLYLGGMSLLPDLRRVFMYHGAEHKSIFAWEDGQDLSPGAARGKSRYHPRCSTAFLLLVVVVAILVFSLTLPSGLPLPRRLLGEVALVLPIAGVTYELQRLAARHSRAFWARWLSRPGLALQRLTTREPDGQQLEVALTALRAALDLERARLGDSSREAAACGTN